MIVEPEMASWAALGKSLMAAERGQRKEGMKAYLGQIMTRSINMIEVIITMVNLVEIIMGRLKYTQLSATKER